MAPNISPILIGILNITPDSFSDGGRFLESPKAIFQAKKLLEESASIIDIGGESTAPGSSPIQAEEEISRVLPVVQALATSTPISIDTYKARTAAACLEAGAQIINDVSALRADPEMGRIIAEHRAQVVLMHSKEEDSQPHASSSQKDYADIVQEIADWLKRRVDYALSCGIAESKIILDPGMGRFLSHDSKYSWVLLQELPRLVELLQPFPILIGLSRKGFLSKQAVLARDGVSQLCNLVAALRGARYIRTHDPGMAAEFFRVWRKLHGEC